MRYPALLPTLFSLALLAGLLESEEAAPPDHQEEPAYSASERSHWSLKPRSRPTPPSFENATDRNWIESLIDAFILRKQKAAGLKPAPRADRGNRVAVDAYVHSSKELEFSASTFQETSYDDIESVKFALCSWR